MTKLWRIYCEEDRHPGLWRRWFKNQCVAVGWSACKLYGPTKGGTRWLRARKAIIDMEKGDLILVTLKDKKIGRLGEIVEKRIKDDQQDPFVPPSSQFPQGDIGRRILVRWDLTTGPDDPDMIIQIPDKLGFNSGERQGTIKRIRSKTISQVRNLMKDPRNWVGLSGKFRYETALSDYIATYPHHLEDGITQHPNLKIREMVYKDKKRSDVILLDRKENPVVVECKQHPASVKHIKQLRKYVLKVNKLTGQETRGILVHSGSQKLTEDVFCEAKKQPVIEIVCYRLRVDFTRSTK